ncbi:hypothetical protein LJB94_00950 [Odoribacter sp. OttesenSCG-928-G04]|nr:hypothetical protein [Odoribacter sp. OttesenSCG-928-G04]
MNKLFLIFFALLFLNCNPKHRGSSIDKVNIIEISKDAVMAGHSVSLDTVPRTIKAIQEITGDELEQFRQGNKTEAFTLDNVNIVEISKDVVMAGHSVSLDTVPRIIKAIQEITGDELEQFRQGNKTEAFTLIIKPHELSLLYDGWYLFYFILGYDNSVEGIQKEYNNIFNVEHQIIKDSDFDRNDTIYKLSYKDSFIKTFFNQQNGRYDIVSGMIRNKEIFLDSDIYIGISKNDFMNNLFENASDYTFTGIDTIFRGDALGDILHCYFFSEDTLKEVRIQSNYDRIPFD